MEVRNKGIRDSMFVFYTTDSMHVGNENQRNFASQTHCIPHSKPTSPMKELQYAWKFLER